MTRKGRSPELSPAGILFFVSFVLFVVKYFFVDLPCGRAMPARRFP
jgi:hypothetical protein